MADPSPSFMPSLMTWVFIKESIYTLNTNFFFSKNTFSPSPFLYRLFFFFSNTYTHLLRSSPLIMAPVKSQGSSRRKGKEVASDPPAVPVVGERSEYSESEHSVGEKTQRDPDSECAPLIDPCYEVHPHFPKIPGDHASPPTGRMWLALWRRNPDVSWAPLASSIPNLVNRQGISLPVPIHFEVGSGTTLGWRE